jgi:hypothetical protein
MIYYYLGAQLSGFEMLSWSPIPDTVGSTGDWLTFVHIQHRIGVRNELTIPVICVEVVFLHESILWTYMCKEFQVEGIWKPLRNSMDYWCV